MKHDDVPTGRDVARCDPVTHTPIVVKCVHATLILRVSEGLKGRGVGKKPSPEILPQFAFERPVPHAHRKRDGQV